MNHLVVTQINGDVVDASSIAGEEQHETRYEGHDVPDENGLERVALADGNLMPAILAAVRAYATVGEISDRLRVTWGEHRELITV